MNAQPFDLPTLQAWMQSLMMDAESSPPQPGGLSVEVVITASSQQTSRQRLDVYGNAYFARLMECLREEFATLCQFLGEDVFDSLAVAYLQAHPSQSYTLGQLGAGFPRFLRESEEFSATDSEESHFAGTQFLIDLATLERLYAEVFDGPGIEGLPAIMADSLRAIPPAAWPDVRFEPAPCLRLMEFAYPVHEFVTACRHGTEPPLPEPKQTWLAVTRRHYIVRRVALTEQQFRLLSLLSQGITLGAALDDVAQACDDLDAFSREIESWFHDWTAAGFFQAAITG